jgi:hypothetical protein
MNKLILWCLVLCVMVTCQKQTITLPSSINVAKGGCTNTGVGVGGLQSSLTLNIQPAANSSDFNVSSNQIVFTPQQSNASIVFCASRTISAKTVFISLSLSGPDSSNFNLLSPNIQANIIDGSNTIQQLNTNGVSSGINPNNFVPGLVIPTINPNPTSVTPFISTGSSNPRTTSRDSPTIQLSVLNTSINSAQYNVTTNSNGTVYYSVQVGTWTSPSMTLASIEAAVQSGQFIIQSPSDMLTWVYSSDRDLQVNSLSVTKRGSSTLNISGLRPSKIYTFCAYLVNTNATSSNAQCSTFNTTDEPLLKAIFTFTTPINPSQMNNLLCFLATAASL